MQATYDFERTRGLLRKPGGVVALVTYASTCPGSDLKLALSHVISPEVDDCGVVADAWWVVTCDDMPRRFFRLFHGKESLERLILKYGLMNSKGCVHYDRGKVHLTDTVGDLTSLPPPPLPGRALQCTGVPQRVANSGLCWWSATCWCLFYCPAVRDIVVRNMTPRMAELTKTCLVDKKASEELRELLWNYYRFGDPIGQDPLLDGQNGMSEFYLLASRVDIPVLRIGVDDNGQHPITDPVVDK